MVNIKKSNPTHRKFRLWTHKSVKDNGLNCPVCIYERPCEAVFTAAAVAWILAITGTILKICDATIGLRVTREQETEGLDVSMHGEEGYVFEQ